VAIPRELRGLPLCPVSVLHAGPLPREAVNQAEEVGGYVARFPSTTFFAPS
jgi:hypothetical protein